MSEDPKYMPVDVSTSHPILRIEVTPDAIGKMFVCMSDEEQAAVLSAIAEHMEPHPMQWDYIKIEMEKPEHTLARARFGYVCEEDQ